MNESTSFVFNNDSEIKLPGNLSIIATMNTSDQNVFTLDTAFKRRWEFEKISNIFTDDHLFKELFIPGMKIDWEHFVNNINDYILQSGASNSEDKQIGVYFVDGKGLRKSVEDVSTIEDRKKFAYKIFEYLWDDVAKFDHEKWFNTNIKSLDQLIQTYVKEGSNDIDGIKVFNNGIFKD